MLPAFVLIIVVEFCTRFVYIIRLQQHEIRPCVYCLLLESSSCDNVTDYSFLHQNEKQRRSVMDDVVGSGPRAVL